MRMRNRLLFTAAALLILQKVVERRRHWRGFRGRVVLITGGSRGLGLVMARLLAARGARVAVCARDHDELQRARADLERFSSQVLTLRCDVTDKAQVDRLVQEVERDFGPIDVLINNAGIIQVGPLETMTLADYEAAMSVHYWAPLYATLAVLPGMRERGAGRIVNIASIGGKISAPHLLPYNASKAALIGLSEGMRAELSKDGVYVTTVCPSLIRTGSPLQALFKGKNRLEYAWFSATDSLPGISMSAERAARRILEACRRGEAEVVLSIPARLAAGLHGLFPGFTAAVLTAVNRLLPGAGGIGTRSRRGYASRSAIADFLSQLSREAERRNNELPPESAGDPSPET